MGDEFRVRLMGILTVKVELGLGCSEEVRKEELWLLLCTEERPISKFVALILFLVIYDS